jgi:FkbM family methyltransferase
MNIDDAARKMQNALGDSFTQCAQKYLGRNGTRFVRELLGRSPRHRIQLKCKTQVLGSGDASWVICPDLLTRESIVYSIGIGTDISFDLELIARFGLSVFAFDPTPTTAAWLKTQQIPKEFYFCDYGISSADGWRKFFRLGGQLTTCPSATSRETLEFRVHKLKTAMETFHHTHIDLLKMDIEGEEYDVIEDMIDSKVSVGQLTIEFHHRFPGIGKVKTETAVAALNGNGYQIFEITDSGREYSFVKT